MVTPIYTHSSGIGLRKVDACDLEDLLNLKNESWFGTHRLSLVNNINQQKWLESINGENIHCPSNLVLVAAAAGENVGVYKVLNIDWQSRLADVGWDIYEQHRGKGLGKKLVLAGADFCFGVLNLHRINAQVLETNVVSHKCAQSAGFKKEGHQPKAIWRGGKWVDNIIYGKINESNA